MYVLRARNVHQMPPEAQHIKTIIKNIIGWVERDRPQIPRPVLKVFEEYVWNRSNDLMENGE